MGWSLWSFTFLAGLTFFGLAGATMEAACGKRLTFDRPYICTNHVMRSAAAGAVAGPFMLVNDAMDAAREGRIGYPMLAGCVATALCWALCAGVVLMALASIVAGPIR